MNTPNKPQQKQPDSNSPDSSAQLTPSDEKTDSLPEDNRQKNVEHGGPKGLEPTRYGDWERNGRCTDF